VDVILALDLGTSTGWALRSREGFIVSGVERFQPGRYEGGGMRFLRFKRWLTDLKGEQLDAVYFEEVRRHLGTDAAHLYGGFLGVLGLWCEHHSIAYLGVPVGTLKKHGTGKGNAGKPEMVEAARRLFHGVVSSVSDDNEADALILLDYALEHLHARA
jgi:Holliday junction resolvasome RuvABC endonuclease subunit